jgi:hypothetical protein
MAQSGQLDKISYTHEAIADWLMTNPQRPLSECAAEFNYSQAWISTIINSDAFQVYYNQRRNALNLVIHNGISQQLATTTRKALTILDLKMDDPELEADFVLDVADRLLHRQGYAPGKVSVIQNNINIPAAGVVDQGTLSRARETMRAIQRSAGHTEEVLDVLPDGSVITTPPSGE